MTLAASYKDALTALQRDYRTTRSRYDLLYFTYEYFSDDCNPENEDNLIPTGSTMDSAPKFHHELCEMLEHQSLQEPTSKICWSVPRGFAKSLFVSNVYPLHSICFNLRKYIMIISETESISQNFLEFIGNQLKHNKKLRADFGELLHPSRAKNDTDNLEAFVTKNGVKVQAVSNGKAIRGSRHQADRPDLLVCDDLESARNTNTQELRNKSKQWFDSVVLPVGTPEKTGILYVGTLVHSDGLLPYVAKKPDFKSRSYSAILEDSDHPELWLQYTDILMDYDNEYRLEEAEAFYTEHEAEMLEGTSVLWEARFPYKELIKKKLEIGSSAFNSEFLNSPADSGSRVFNPDSFQYFTDADLINEAGKRKVLKTVSFWDLALGKSKRSDFNAIVTIAKDQRSGIIYVLDIYLERVPLHVAFQKAVEKIDKIRPNCFGVEAVAAQYETYRQLLQDVHMRSIYGTKIVPVLPKGSKDTRIEGTLEPLIESGMLKFRKEQRALLEQLTLYPHVKTDDGIDALASAILLLPKVCKRTYQKKPAGL